MAAIFSVKAGPMNNLILRIPRYVCISNNEILLD